MAAEDGACIGALLGLLQRTSNRPTVASVLRLYENLRKERTTKNIQGAVNCQKLFHLSDEKERKERNELFKGQEWDEDPKDFPWLWGNQRYQQDLLAFDVVKDAKQAYQSRFSVSV